MSNNEPQNKLFQTNNYSIISKYSCVKSGYQRDDVLETFMEKWLKVKSWKRTPQINRGYAARMMSIDWIVNRSIKFDGVDCFVILGAGFDFLPKRVQNSSNCVWIELDLPEVVSAKSKFIQSEKILGNGEELLQVRDGMFRSTSSRYHLVECDLRNSGMLSASLGEIFSSLNVKNVAILNEVCLCYIEVNEINKILSTVINAVQKFAFRLYYIGYEQYRPNEESPFNDVMTEHFSSMSYPLEHFPTSHELRQLFLHHLKFNHLTITPIHQLYNTALGEDRDTFKEAYTNEPFDEYEELSLYLSHYALVTGVLIFRDPFMDLATRFGESECVREELASCLSDLALEHPKRNIEFVDFNLDRYGHSSCALEAEDGSYSIFVSGGFGKSPKRGNITHRRLDDCMIMKAEPEEGGGNFSTRLVGTENVDPKLVRLDRMHGEVLSLGESKLFFNGGRQSPNKKDNLNASFTARLLDDNELDIMHVFERTTEFVRWRHRICPQNDSYQFLQVGGLSASINHTDPIVLWNLSADKLGAYVIHCNKMEIFQRHSFAMDALDEATIMLMGGMQSTSDHTKDRPVDSYINTVLWDTRRSTPDIMSYDCADCYGASIHSIGNHQLIKIGGISTRTGLAQSTIEMLDLRNKRNLLIEEDQLPLANQRMILTNSSVCHARQAREIITTGGGGNYFTFGTRFNKSSLVCRYT